jgi:hypothetical protein
MLVFSGIGQAGKTGFSVSNHQGVIALTFGDLGDELLSMRDGGT